MFHSGSAPPKRLKTTGVSNKNKDLNVGLLLIIVYSWLCKSTSVPKLI